MGLLALPTAQILVSTVHLDSGSATPHVCRPPLATYTRASNLFYFFLCFLPWLALGSVLHPLPKLKIKADVLYHIHSSTTSPDEFRGSHDSDSTNHWYIWPFLSIPSTPSRFGLSAYWYAEYIVSSFIPAPWFPHTSSPACIPLSLSKTIF